MLYLNLYLKQYVCDIIDINKPVLEFWKSHRVKYALSSPASSIAVASKTSSGIREIRIWSDRCANNNNITLRAIVTSTTACLQRRCYELFIYWDRSVLVYLPSKYLCSPFMVENKKWWWLLTWNRKRPSNIPNMPQFQVDEHKMW